METDALIDRLVAGLEPVRPRNRRREMLAIAALVLVEIALFLLLRDLRPDMPEAMVSPVFWWKAGASGGLALYASAAVLAALDPATPRRPGLARRGSFIVAALALALGWLVGKPAPGTIADRLEWRDGVDCLVNITLLTLPLLLAFGVLMRRGAPTRPRRTATAAGLAAAGFGTCVFAFHCPHDDPLYVLAWYGGAVALLTLFARVLLPRLARW